MKINLAILQQINWLSRFWAAATKFCEALYAIFFLEKGKSFFPSFLAQFFSIFLLNGAQKVNNSLFYP
jgi:hypothetical protein